MGASRKRLPSVAIRRAESDDLELVLAVNRASALAAYGAIFGSTAFPADRVRERYRRLLDDPTSQCFLAERAGTVVGFIVARPTCLEALYVLPDCWQGGIGSRLYEAAEPVLRSDARLWVLAASGRGRQFWESRGWRADGRRKVEHGMVELRYRRDEG